MDLTEAYIEYSQKIQKEMNSMVDLSGIFGKGHKSDLSVLLDEDQQPLILFNTFFQRMHNFYYGSLRIQS